MKEKPLKQKWYSLPNITHDMAKTFHFRPLTLCIASIQNFFLLLFPSLFFLFTLGIFLNVAVAVPDCVLYVSIIEMENRFIWLIIFFTIHKLCVYVEARCVPTDHRKQQQSSRSSCLWKSETLFSWKGHISLFFMLFSRCLFDRMEGI